ncbi:MAG: hypothetical protein KBC67_00510 [Candidatus Pacebacteria bacterium]|nr:hypothetical protein [Candidatus Paceibacterota bacterium]
MSNNINQNNKFRGGAWIGSWQITWPFITLEVREDQLILKNSLFKKEYYFTRDSVEKIEVKKYLPIIGHGINIVLRDKSKETKYYFWYWSFRFDSLIDSLKKFGWYGARV